MSLDDIRIYGDPVLRKKAEKVTAFDDHLKALVEEMFPVMFEADGVGLAATQLGIMQAFMVIGLPRENQEPERLFIANPQLLEARGESALEEGCLSVPGIREEVVRPEWIRLRYADIDGLTKELETDGLLARVVQHELDHLEGILFVDRISPARKALLKNELRKLVEESKKKREGMAA